MEKQRLVQLEIEKLMNSKISNKTDKQLNRILVARRIKQYSLNGEFIAEYHSKSYAEKKLGLQPGGLDRAFTSKKLNSYGFIWRYADEELVMKPVKRTGPTHPKIEIYSISGKKLKIVFNAKEVCQFLDIPDTTNNLSRISRCLNGNSITFNNHFLAYENSQGQKAVFQITKTTRQTIEQYTLDGELVASYSTLTDAAKSLGYNRSTLSRYIKLKNGQYNGFIFKVLNLSNQ